MGLSFIMLLLGAVAGGVILAGLISGACLLIVGLARRQRRMWIGGLVTLVASLVVGALVGAGVLMVTA